MFIQRKHRGSGDMSWLGSRWGTDNAFTGTVVVDNFTKATHFPDGYIPAGTPVNRADLGALAPYTDGAEAVLGFILTDQIVPDGVEAFAVPVLWAGVIRTDKVPGEFTVPETGEAGKFEFDDGSVA